MVNWIRKKLHNFMFPQDVVGSSMASGKNLTISRDRSLNSRGMSFSIHQANGGYVMEYTAYDEKTDRNANALHIITSDQDLGQGIAHAITLEMLRK